jgi:cytochrome c
LQGVIGRQVATRPDFNYSSSLRKVEGTWTDKRLADFLENPQAFAPGTAMGSVGVVDPVERMAIVEYLKHYERDGS